MDVSWCSGLYGNRVSRLRRRELCDQLIMSAGAKRGVVPPGVCSLTRMCRVGLLFFKRLLPSLPAGRSSKRCDGSSWPAHLCTRQSATHHSIRMHADGMRVAPGQGLAPSPPRPPVPPGPTESPKLAVWAPAHGTHRLTRSQGPCLTGKPGTRVFIVSLAPRTF